MTATMTSEAAGARGDRFLEVHHCPRCGRAYGPQDFNPVDVVFLCTACGFDHYQNPLPAAVAVVVDAARPDDLLMIKRRTPPRAGLWCLPGGFIRYGEAPESAAIREVREEAGADVLIQRLLRAGQVDYTYRGRRVWVVELSFVAHLIDPSASRWAPTEEAEELRFVNVDTALTAAYTLAFPEQAMVLAAYRDWLRGLA